jgi:hypothetical protein
LGESIVDAGIVSGVADVGEDRELQPACIGGQLPRRRIEPCGGTSSACRNNADEEMSESSMIHFTATAHWCRKFCTRHFHRTTQIDGPKRVELISSIVSIR